MGELGDHPLLDSEFGRNKDGSLWEIGYGALADYRASNATGEWEVVAIGLPVLRGRLAAQLTDLRGMLPTRAGSQGYPHRDPAAIDLYVVHYTATAPTTRVEAIARYHTGPSAPVPFPAIAYHLVVEQNGELALCHDWVARTWGSGGLGINDRAVHACYTGDLGPNDAQLAALRAGLRLAQRDLGRQLEVRGHRDNDATACPGPTWPSWKELIAA